MFLIVTQTVSLRPKLKVLVAARKLAADAFYAWAANLKLIAESTTLV